MPVNNLSLVFVKVGPASQPDISPAVWQLGRELITPLVAGRQSPLLGDKRLSISTGVTSESCHERTWIARCHSQLPGS